MSTNYDQWDAACGVRSGPRHLLEANQAPEATHFPLALVPYAAEVEKRWGRPVCQELLVHRLYEYLRFTELLELKSINHVGNLIAFDELMVPMSRELRSQAFLLIRDEAHHATGADDVAHQIELATDVSRLPSAKPQFLYRLGAMREAHDKDLAALIDVAFATISETLISGSLAQIPKDPNVVSLVRGYTADHARDEARHSSYFSEFFARFWPQLPVAVREQLGPLLPELSLAFLEPDYASHQRVLEAIGLSATESRKLVQQAYPAEQAATAVRRPLQGTIRLFQRVGVFDDHRTHDAFAERGLIG